jgi:[protein-PII] uridylyltransferase
MPELHACMTVLPGDASHLFTVGEHSIRVLEHLTRLRPRPPSAVGYYTAFPHILGDPTGPVADWEEPIVAAYRELLVTLDSPATLLLAALLHDVGKQWRTLRDGTRAPHALTGAERTPEICARLGCPPAMGERVTFLVREHLLMAETSRLRDLSLSETVRDFARVVGDRETLRMLYLLTWADTSAVGPGTWTPMKARQLSELFDRADAFLAAEASRRGESAAGEAPDADLPGDAEEAARRMGVVRDRVRRQLAREAERTRSAGEVSPDAIHAYIEAMPSAYLLNTPPSVMALHLDLVTRLEASSRAADPTDPFAARRPVVDMRNPAPAAEGAAPGAMTAATGAVTDLTVVAWDDPQPGLLAKITGVLLAYDINIHGVQAFTRDFSAGHLGHGEEDGSGDGDSAAAPRRVVIDTLSVDHRDRPLPALKRADVEEALVRVLSGEQELSDLLSRRRAPFADAGPAVSPLAQRVRLIDDAAGGGSLTLIDVEAADEPGVVYRCAARFSALGWDIHSARVSTWAGSVRCAFYITGPDGAPVPADAVRAGLEAVPVGQ